MIRRDFLRTALLSTALALAAIAPAHAASIYDANVANRLTSLTAAQKQQVLAITTKSKTNMLAVMQKYGIDPNGTPQFNLLQKAGNELQAVQRAERKEMMGVLDKAQMKQYDAIINETSARVRKAAQ
ncbi:MAG: hypothetical protein U1E46_13565 [Hyphomicrobiales bacterium]